MMAALAAMWTALDKIYRGRWVTGHGAIVPNQQPPEDFVFLLNTLVEERVGPSAVRKAISELKLMEREFPPPLSMLVKLCKKHKFSEAKPHLRELGVDFEVVPQVEKKVDPETVRQTLINLGLKRA